MILQAVRDKVDDPGRMRALGFCVSIGHAEFMAEWFTDSRRPAAGGDLADVARGPRGRC